MTSRVPEPPLAQLSCLAARLDLTVEVATQNAAQANYEFGFLKTRRQQFAADCRQRSLSGCCFAAR